EVTARRSAWRRYEERLGGEDSAVPGAEIRLEAGQRAPLPALVVEGTGTAIGADGLPVPIQPGAHVHAGARLSGGPFVVQLWGEGGRSPSPDPCRRRVPSTAITSVPWGRSRWATPPCGQCSPCRRPRPSRPCCWSTPARRSSAWRRPTSTPPPASCAPASRW